MVTISSTFKNIYKIPNLLNVFGNFGNEYEYVDGAPATNNSIENYYSTSLKTHRKKQFRTDIGINNQLQLSSMKRAGMFNEKKPTILERWAWF